MHVKEGMLDILMCSDKIFTMLIGKLIRKQSNIVSISICILGSMFVSSCQGEPSQTTPVNSPTALVETIVYSQTPTRPSTLTPSTFISASQENTPEPYPFQNIGSDIPHLNSTQNPYPGIPLETQIPENTWQPYPGPGLPTQGTPIPESMQQPYPGPDLQSEYLTQQAETNNPYIPPQQNLPTNNPTQLILSNPIQTPDPTLGINPSEQVKVTSTSVVWTGLHATDPDTVKLDAGKYQFIEFFAFWCPTCKSMAPVINGLEAKYQGRISFIYLDIDDLRNKPFKEKLGYKYQPHFFLLDGQGKIVSQWVGFVTLESFESVLMPIFP